MEEMEQRRNSLCARLPCPLLSQRSIPDGAIVTLEMSAANLPYAVRCVPLQW